MTNTKLLSLLLAGIMLIPLTGCGDSATAETQPTAAETEPAEKAPVSLFGSIGQEEAILIALLLLLSAEHERSMDVIIILLLLLGIK